MKKKVLFLDIDGVFNVEVFINAFWLFCKQLEMKRPEAKKAFNELLRDGHGNLFCPTTVNMLEWIIKETGADIVISSTWRYSGLSVMQEMWKSRALPGTVIDITPVINAPANIEFKEAAERGNEIAAWILKHPEYNRYCIVDDDNDMLESQKDYFVQTNSFYGLTNSDANRVVEILNKE